MLKKILLGFLFLPVLFSGAQSNVLTHIVKPGENITQIAGLYKVKLKDIYSSNDLKINSILKVGQKLLVPIGGSIAKNGKPENKPTLSISTNKSYHIIESGETLYKIAKDNNVTIQQLRTWNNLENDNIKLGSFIYFNQQKSLNPETSSNTMKNKQEDVISQSLKIGSIVDENKAKPVNQEIEKNQYQKPEKVAEKIVIGTDISNFNVFEKDYKSTNKSVIGLCGTFKTISGWKDNKYYALMNDAVNGSIVKVKLDNKVIYAKVLGPLPNSKSDGNLTLRISNAAAAVLGVNYDLFEVKVEQ